MMKSSQQKSGHTRGWIGLGIILAAMAFVLIFPIFTPFLGIGLLVGGIIFYRHTNDGQEKGIAIAAIIIGSLMILASIVLFIGVWGFQSSTSTTINTMPYDSGTTN